MADSRFFTNVGPFTLADIATRCEAKLPENADDSAMIADLAALDAAGPDHLTFLENKKYREQAQGTKAAACFVKENDAGLLPEGCVALVSAYPYRSYALAAHLFYPQNRQPELFGDGPRDIDPSAQIHPTAMLGANVRIGAGSVVEAYATIGHGCVIGQNCVIGSHVTLTHAMLGDHVRLFPGARIGQPGFGYAIDPAGNHLYVPQLGRVILGDGVEIGANTTVDRGAGPDTEIGAGTKIDNLCQIAHNVKIGRGCFLAGQVGISGSTKVGNGVFMGGQSGLAGHISIGDGAQLGAQSGFMQDVAGGDVMMGSPAVPIKEFMRREAWLRRTIRSKKDA